MRTDIKALFAWLWLISAGIALVVFFYVIGGWKPFAVGGAGFAFAWITSWAAEYVRNQMRDERS